MSFHIDLEKSLETAEGLYLQLSTFKNVPAEIAEILGLPINESLKEKEIDDVSK